ncbi:hypothetical protein [Acuticoccus sp.]|uniref:hypothetical protein n=1 Tax=Acuticoccus sp. TaxID=1904378 RepID=UPI003B5292F8
MLARKIVDGCGSIDRSGELGSGRPGRGRNALTLVFIIAWSDRDDFGACPR